MNKVRYELKLITGSIFDNSLTIENLKLSTFEQEIKRNSKRFFRYNIEERKFF